MFAKLLHTERNCALTMIRIAAGAVMLPHGLQKLFAFNHTIGVLTHATGIPAWLAFIVIIAESFGALGMILGCLSRIAAFSIFADMVGAALLVNIHNGFSMNWSGTKRGEGIEYHILMGAMALAVTIWGGGSLSIDRLLSGDEAK